MRTPAAAELCLRPPTGSLGCQPLPLPPQAAAAAAPSPTRDGGGRRCSLRHDGAAAPTKSQRPVPRQGGAFGSGAGLSTLGVPAWKRTRCVCLLRDAAAAYAVGGAARLVTCQGGCWGWEFVRGGAGRIVNVPVLLIGPAWRAAAPWGGTVGLRRCAKLHLPPAYHLPHPPRPCGAAPRGRGDTPVAAPFLHQAHHPRQPPSSSPPLPPLHGYRTRRRGGGGPIPGRRHGALAAGLGSVVVVIPYSLPPIRPFGPSREVGCARYWGAPLSSRPPTDVQRRPP